MASNLYNTMYNPDVLSCIANLNHAGTIVTHKAFGTGQVKGIDGGIIVVVFGGVDKKFQFPGAFEQGFLKLDEN